MLKVRFNLRNMIAITICLTGFSVSNVLAQDNTKDQGVIINGIKWATRNVDKHGTFVTSPEDEGMFYQWNRKTAWTTTIDASDLNSSNGDTWEKSNDPSPVGWRVPTFDNINTLLDTAKVSNEWKVKNGIMGQEFTDKTTGNTLFLPAAGYGHHSNGKIYHLGSKGNYWSRTNSSVPGGAYNLVFDNGNASWTINTHHYGLSIRCVAE